MPAAPRSSSTRAVSGSPSKQKARGVTLADDITSSPSPSASPSKGSRSSKPVPPMQMNLRSRKSNTSSPLVPVPENRVASGNQRRDVTVPDRERTPISRRSSISSTTSASSYYSNASTVYAAPANSGTTNVYANYAHPQHGNASLSRQASYQSDGTWSTQWEHPDDASGSERELRKLREAAEELENYDRMRQQDGMMLGYNRTATWVNSQDGVGRILNELDEKYGPVSRRPSTTSHYEMSPPAIPVNDRDQMAFDQMMFPYASLTSGRRSSEVCETSGRKPKDFNKRY